MADTDSSFAQDMAEVARLKALMLKKSFYVMRRRIVAPEKLKAVLLEHYRWLIGLEKDGCIFASGPLFDREDGQGVGMTIFRAADWESAEALAAADPFCISGAAEFELQRWQINEGRVTVAIDFSDQTARID